MIISSIITIINFQCEAIRYHLIATKGEAREGGREEGRGGGREEERRGGREEGRGGGREEGQGGVPEG